MFVINQCEYICAVNGFGIGSIWHQSECNCARAVQIRDNCSSVAKEMVEQCPFKDSAGWSGERNHLQAASRMHACTLRLLHRSSTKHRCTTTQPPTNKTSNVGSTRESATSRFHLLSSFYISCTAIESTYIQDATYRAL
jgi:hypothetical protein